MLTPKETKFIEAKLQGMTQEEAGLAAGAKTIEGARKLATRMSNNVQIQEVIRNSQNLTLLEAGITRAKALKPINDALEATKTIVHGKNTDDSWVEVVPDYSIRLKASDMSLKLLKEQDSQNPTPTNPLEDLDLSNMDTLELKQAIFKRSN